MSSSYRAGTGGIDGGVIGDRTRAGISGTREVTDDRTRTGLQRAR